MCISTARQLASICEKKCVLTGVKRCLGLLIESNARYLVLCHWHCPKGGWTKAGRDGDAGRVKLSGFCQWLGVFAAHGTI